MYSRNDPFANRERRLVTIDWTESPEFGRIWNRVVVREPKAFQIGANVTRIGDSTTHMPSLKIDLQVQRSFPREAGFNAP